MALVLLICLTTEEVSGAILQSKMKQRLFDQASSKYVIAMWDILIPVALFYYHGLTLMQAWRSNYIHYNVWDEITYPFLHFNGAAVEV